MYDNTSIQVLVDRVGWALPIPPSTIVLTSDNTKSDSGRYFDAFHKMAIVENVFNVQPNHNISNADFNVYLYGLKKAATMKVLSAIFDLNERANLSIATSGLRVDISSTDYSHMITTRASIFDDCIGYQVSCDVLELMLLTTRSNQTESVSKYNYQQLKVELDGFTNEGGHLVSKGVHFKLNASIIKAIDILFPRDDRSKKTIRGVSVW